MTVGGLRAALAAVAVAVGLSACGGVNAGTDYAEELSAFLDGQAGVAAHDVRGHNDLPTQGSATSLVTLDSELDEAGVVDAAMAIVTHETSTDVNRHDLTTRFTTTTGSDRSVTTSFYLDLASPLPDSPATRDQLTTLVDLARTYVSADDGLVSLDARSSGVVVETSTDPFVSAPALAAVLEDDGTGPKVQVSRDGVEFVSFDRGGDLTWAAEMQSIVESASDVTEVVRASASADRPRTEPSLALVLSRETPDAVVADLSGRAAAAGIDARVTKAA